MQSHPFIANYRQDIIRSASKIDDIYRSLRVVGPVLDRLVIGGPADTPTLSYRLSPASGSALAASRKLLSDFTGLSSRRVEHVQFRDVHDGPAESAYRRFLPTSFADILLDSLPPIIKGRPDLGAVVAHFKQDMSLAGVHYESLFAWLCAYLTAVRQGLAACAERLEHLSILLTYMSPLGLDDEGSLRVLYSGIKETC